MYQHKMECDYIKYIYKYLQQHQSQTPLINSFFYSFKLIYLFIKILQIFLLS